MNINKNIKKYSKSKKNNSNTKNLCFRRDGIICTSYINRAWL